MESSDVTDDVIGPAATAQDDDDDDVNNPFYEAAPAATPSTSAADRLAKLNPSTASSNEIWNDLMAKVI